MSRRFFHRQLILTCCCLFLFNLIPTSTTAANKPLETIRLQLKWQHQFQFAGYYAAQELGYYKQAGLEVIIQEATESEASASKVINGDADFGIAMSDLVLHRMQGAPVVALATIYQHSPLVFLSSKETGISSIHDLVGKKVMIEAHAEELLAYLKSEGISLGQLNVQSHSFRADNLILGSVDVISAYSTDEPYALAEQGVAYNVFSPRSAGIDFYGDTLFTTEKYLQQHPERVKAFLQATVKGWEYALKNPEEIVDLILAKYSTRHSRKHLLFEARESQKLILPNIVEIGYMNHGRWHNIAKVYAAQGKIPADFSLDGFLYEKNYQPSLTKLYIVLSVVFAVLTLAVLIALRFLSLNNALRRQIAKRQDAEEEKDVRTKELLNATQSQREIMEMFQLVLDTIPQFIFWKDHNCIYLGCNQNFAKAAGVVSPAGIVGKSDFDLAWTEEEAEKFKSDDRRVMDSDLSELNIIERQLQSDGKQAWLRTNKAPLHDNNENVVGVLGTFEDITENILAEEKRLELEAQLSQKFKMEAVGVMAGGMAHNFNNNLSIILGNLELINMQKNLTDQAQEYLKNAKIGVLRSRDLIQQIMTYSRSGTQELAPITLAPVINETMNLLRSMIPTSVYLQYQTTPDSLDASVLANATQVQEALLNLCTNAVHAMDEVGRLTINLDTVALQSAEIFAEYSECSPGNFIHLQVQDTGCGMTDVLLKKIFVPFYTTKGVGEGTGMGLSTVQGMIKKIGGQIKVSSKLGEGTTFDLYFPITDSVRAGALEGKEQILTRGTERILFVDDEEMLANLGETLLSEMGYQVSTMTDSTEAIKIFSANSDIFDLVITDQTMPKLTGKDLIAEIKKIRPNIPTILCTGYSSKIDEDEAPKLGISAFMMKPLELSQLSQTIRQVLDGDKEE
jgi:PAS domain S-box-containing protein